MPPSRQTHPKTGLLHGNKPSFCVAAGVCYRLWDPSDTLDPTTPPEITDADLAPLALELVNWGDPSGDSLPWLDPPDPERLLTARQLLTELGAVDDKGAVTEGGRRMGGLGVHPRFAHLVMKAHDMGCGELGCVVASLLSERDVIRGAGPGAGAGAGAGLSADISLRLSALAGEGGWVRVIEHLSVGMHLGVRQARVCLGHVACVDA